MMDNLLPPWMDAHKAGQIVQLRALGFSQAEIALQLGVSQQTVSRYLREVRNTALGKDDLTEFLFGLLIIGAGAAALGAIFGLLKSK